MEQCRIPFANSSAVVVVDIFAPFGDDYRVKLGGCRTFRHGRKIRQAMRNPRIIWIRTSEVRHAYVMKPTGKKYECDSLVSRSGIHKVNCSNQGRGAGLTVEPSGDFSAAQLKRLMKLDKKVQDGKIRLVLMKAIGQSFVTGNYDESALDRTLALYAVGPEQARGIR